MLPACGYGGTWQRRRGFAGSLGAWSPCCHDPRQAQLRAQDGSLFVLTDSTPVRGTEVRQGVRVQCTVTVRLARVVAAQILP